MPTLSEALANAVQHQRAGRLQAAEQIYRQILAVDPDHHHASHLLEVIACQDGQYQAGAECIQRALAYRPDWAAAHYNLGNAWRDQGKLDEAVACYQRALQRKPDFALKRSSEYLTSSAVTSRPLTGGLLWNFTPGRILKR